MNQTIYPMEIKKSASPSKDNIRHFSVLENLKMNIGHGGLICMTDQSIPINAAVDAIPASII